MMIKSDKICNQIAEFELCIKVSFLVAFLSSLFSFCRVVSAIMKLKILLLFIGLCTISWNRVVAENEEGMFYNPFLVVKVGIC